MQLSKIDFLEVQVKRRVNYIMEAMAILLHALLLHCMTKVKKSSYTALLSPFSLLPAQLKMELTLQIAL